MFTVVEKTLSKTESLVPSSRRASLAVFPKNGVDIHPAVVAPTESSEFMSTTFSSGSEEKLDRQRHVESKVTKDVSEEQCETKEVIEFPATVENSVSSERNIERSFETDSPITVINVAQSDVSTSVTPTPKEEGILYNMPDSSTEDLTQLESPLGSLGRVFRSKNFE